MALKVAVVPVTAFQQNCSIVWCDETMEGAVVDPGGDLPRIKEVIAKHGVKLTKVLVTHAHIDHAGEVASCAEAYGVPIEGPQKDEQYWIDMLPEQGSQFGLGDARVFEPTRWLEDNDEVRVGNVLFKVVHCPGHTPGHVVFVDEKDRIAMVGDVIFQYSIGRTDLPQGNHQQLIDAIRDKLFPLGDDITFVPGHGPTSTFGQERKMNPFVSDVAIRGHG